MGNHRLDLFEKMMSCKILLFAKYNGIVFLDKNPEGEDGDEHLEDVQLWEEHKIFDVFWIKKKGWGVWMKLTGGALDGEQQVHSINAASHANIRASTKMVRRMFARMGHEPGEDAADGQPHEWDSVQHEVLEGLSQPKAVRSSSSSEDDDSSPD